ncbi:MAG: hypothetical protein IAF58_06065 [Leptolyngbya sp.]|nr:hypothetical protein [Candidatus Melainabacteria bacterium]
MKIEFDSRKFGRASYAVAAILLSFSVLHPAFAQTAKATSGVVQPQATKPAPPLDQTIPAWANGPSIHFSKTAPANFPVPDYTSRVTQRAFFNSTSGQPTATLTITTQDEPQTVFNFYLNACRSSGWQTTVPSPEALSKMGPAGNLYFLNGTKNKQSISIVCTRSKSDMKGTNLNISWALNR